jgi:glycosyltransferase involved in cell wall biosynthesis
MLENFGVPNYKISISPIPVDFPRIDLTEERSNVIAFVGRIHIERGLSEWVEIIALLYKMRTDFEVYVIGAGPRSEEFLLSLNGLSKDLVIRNFGYLHRSDLETKWKFIKVLLSSAPSEGYGLTIREAVVAGAFVCARTSEGSKNLSNQLPDLVRTYESPGEAAAILSTLLNEDFPTDQAQRFIEELDNQNFRHVETLVRSWI